MADEDSTFSGFGEARQARPSGKAVVADDDVAGHRSRLRARFKSSGPDALADYELLEMVLFRSIARADTKPIAKALLKKFHTVGGVFAAPESLLREVPGVGEAVALDLKLVFAARTVC
jgi:DNA repair protein RadC